MTTYTHASEYDVTFIEVDDLLRHKHVRSELVGKTVCLTFRDKRPPSSVEGIVQAVGDSGAILVRDVLYDLQDITQVALHTPRRVPFYRSERFKDFVTTLYDHWPLIVGLVLVVSATAWMGHLSDRDAQYQRRLMDQCMADGKKEYECVALLRKSGSGASTTVVPVPIYMPR